jgi:putative Holliday junction resolvase
MVADPSLPLQDFAARLAPRARLVGIDLGTKTIGLALSDVERRFASPLETIRRSKFRTDAERLLTLCARHGVGGLVIGMPYNMDGSEGPRAQATRAFARNLAQLTELPMTLWDERLSTVAAEQAMIAADVSRAKRAERIDAVAAAFILEGALDRLNRP